MSKLLEGKVAVITGGGQGVGLGIAQEFVEVMAVVAADTANHLLSARHFHIWS